MHIICVRRFLENLLNVAHDMSITWLSWLRQSPLKPNSSYMREHIERDVAVASPAGRARPPDPPEPAAEDGARGRANDVATWPSSRTSDAMRRWRRWP